MQNELLELYFEDTIKEIAEAQSLFEKISSAGDDLYEFIKKLKNLEVASSMLGIKSNSDFVMGIKDIFIDVNSKGMEINDKLREKTVKALDTIEKYLKIQKEKYEGGLDIEEGNSEELQEKGRVLTELQMELEKVMENNYDFELYNFKVRDKLLKVLELSGKVEFLEKDGRIILNYSSKLNKNEILNLFSNISIPYFTLKGVFSEGQYETMNEFYINLEIHRENVREVYQELFEIRNVVKDYKIIDNFKNSDIYAVQLLESFKS